MNQKCLLITILFILYSTLTISQNKIPLDHSVYDGWNTISGNKISNDGSWVIYEINPQAGDGTLHIFNTNNDFKQAIKRGYYSSISPDNKFAAFKIKPQYDTLRQAKIDKIKKDKLPKDTLGIYLFKTDSIKLFERVKSYKLPKDKGNFICFLHEKKIEVKDTSKTEVENEVEKEEKKEGKNKGNNKGNKKDKKKGEGTELKIYYPEDDKIYQFEDIISYEISDNGKYVGIIKSIEDSIKTESIIIFNTKKRGELEIFSEIGEIKKFSFSKSGEKSAFLFSADSTDIKNYSLYISKEPHKNVELLIDTNSILTPDNYCVSELSYIYFSDNESRLYYGISEYKNQEEKDTIPDDEKVSLDIWHWQDKRLQTQQLSNLKRDKEKSYLSFYDFDSEKSILLENDTLSRVRIPDKRNSPFALAYNKSEYERQRSWDANYLNDVYSLNLKTGEKELVIKEHNGHMSISSSGKYAIWFKFPENEWHCKDLSSKKSTKISGEITVSFTNEEHDTPDNPGTYGIAGWTNDDKYVLIYDRFDIWKMDPKGFEKPVRLTKGREHNINYRIIKLDSEKEFLNIKEDLFINSFNEADKSSAYGLLSWKNQKYTELYVGDFKLSRPRKAKDSDQLLWRQESFIEYPDLWTSKIDLTNKKKISEANPQQNKYLWGSVDLISWELDGKNQTGLLYKPENFDTNKKYPLLVYFYEKYSDDMHSHYYPKPSRSVINFTYYTSNGYFIFIPDIDYEIGHPGESARKVILSGTEAISNRKYIDKDNIGIQGQSWGGYQVAYLVTVTDMFKAAMAGAPVSNMTSAYGGIRWESGMNRMFQYEMGQSRIGSTLWENPELYIDNSPLFKADKINTPLLIMHNDNDGAVPWYQGIELFVAMRRLDKPVWMLNYNNAPHNLKRRADSKDLTIRMQQFFDHYLKGIPPPEWLAKGRPAIDKKTNKAYKLIEN